MEIIMVNRTRRRRELGGLHATSRGIARVVAVGLATTLAAGSGVWFVGADAAPVTAQAAPVTAQAAHAAHALARPKAKVHLGKSTIAKGKRVTISTKGSRAPAQVRSVVVKFGDKTRSVKKPKLSFRVRHTYKKTGIFKVTVRVTDKKGRIGKAHRWISVTSGAKLPHGTGASLPTRDVRPGSPLVGAVGLPASVNLRSDAVDVGYQDDLGSCVSWAIGYGMIGWYANHTGRAGAPFAPMYIYSQLVKSKDEGSTPKQALDVAETQGIDTAQHYSNGGDGWAYDWQTQPNASQHANAAHYKVLGARPLFAHVDGAGAGATDVYSIKAELAAQHPVAISMSLFGSFMNFKGSAVFHDTSSHLVGYHEMLALGYDANGLLVQNSWGAAWGNSGYVVIGWDAVARDVYEADVVDGLAAAIPSGDTTSPTVTAPTQTISTGATLNSTGAPVTISWSGSDDRGSVTYDLWASTNGRAWTQQTLSSATATSASFRLSNGSQYEFAVVAIDAAGNRSAWSYGPSFAVSDYSDSSTGVSYTDGWTRFPWSSADGGYLATSSKPGATATFRFTGRNVAWVATKASNRGQAYVYLDGNYQSTVDLYSASTVPQTFAIVGNSSNNVNHTLQIVVVGTSGRPDVDVDSFVVLG